MFGEGNGESATDARAKTLDARAVYAVFGVCFAALPFLTTEYVPATDLPQHIAQVRLLRELWGLAPHTVDAAQLVARPFGANSLCYWPLLALSMIMDLRLAGKLTLLAYVLAAVVALHWLAHRRGRHPRHALLAGVLLFNVSLYWGLLNFLCGLPLFLVFCERALGPRAGRGWRAVAGDVLLLLGLCWAHVLWVLWAGLLATGLALHGLWTRRDVRGAARWAAYFVPLALAIVPWIVAMRDDHSSSADMGAHYLVPLAARVSFGWLTTTLFGGVEGLLEPLVTLGLLGYALGAWLTLRRARRAAAAGSGDSPQPVDRALLALGLAFGAFAWLAPTQYLNTILFNERFLACAGMLLLLALPAPDGRALRAIAIALCVGFSVFTTLAWTMFDQVDLSGLRASLAAIDRPRSVLGLDFRQRSTFVRDRPFMQLFAYAQAEHGGELSFSFADHQRGIVARRPRVLPWTIGLEWFPERATDADIAAFDCVLVNGEDAQQLAFARRSGRRSPIRAGYFRVYCRE